jgi:hypothetical protein
MKRTHLAAIACFAIALVLYVFAAAHQSAAGFAFIGGIFELMAWRRLLFDRAPKQ